MKRENEYLSEILFSQDEEANHFDNMKIVITQLMEKVNDEKQIDNVADCLRMADDILELELMTQD